MINDVNLHFGKAIHWKERNEWIRNCQIDHVVVGPTGVFLIETKNWKASDIEAKSFELKHQVLRSNRGLWVYLQNNYWLEKGPGIRNVIVSMKGNPSNIKLDTHIDILTPQQLPGYITGKENIFDENAIKKAVEIIKRPQYQRPQF